MLSCFLERQVQREAHIEEEKDEPSAHKSSHSHFPTATNSALGMCHAYHAENDAEDRKRKNGRPQSHPRQT